MKIRKQKLRTRRLLDRGVLYNYIGEIDGGVPNGSGTLESIDKKELFQGNWLRGRKVGIGKYTWSDGSTYEGNFENNIPCKQGLFKQGNLKAEGSWFNGFVSNDVNVVWENSSFIGVADSGVLHGKGEYLCQNLNLKAQFEYSGQWSNGKPHGFGVRKTKNSRVEGFFFQGKPNGLCQALLKMPGLNKLEYNGFFNNGKFSGYGRLKETNHQIITQRQYDGMWKDGTKCGHGVICIGSIVYDGDWENGEPHGKGILITAKFEFYLVQMKYGVVEHIRCFCQDVEALELSSKTEKLCACLSLALKKNVKAKHNLEFDSKYPFVNIIYQQRGRKTVKKVFVGNENCKI